MKQDWIIGGVFMADKVTLRFEQFDANASGDIITSGPVVLDGTLDVVSELENLILRGTSNDVEPLTPEDKDLFLDLTTMTLYEYNTDAFVEKLVINKSFFYSQSEKLIYEYSANEWKEKPAQSLVYYIRNVFDAVAPEVVVDMKYRGAYYTYIELTDSWQEIMLGTHTHENKEFLDRLGAFDYNEAVGTKKYFTLEVVDTDNTELTYEYDLNWEDLPESIPAVPENSEGLYLGHDENGTPIWKNTFLAAQTFQLKQLQVESETTSVVFENIHFEPTLDEALILVGKFFVYNRTLTFDPLTNELTVTLTSDEDVVGEVEAFEPGETVTMFIIRNGASAVLDTLAADYLTKAEAVDILSGGGVNLKDYINKSEIRGYAKKYHTHSQFARVDHDHDYRYAMFNHTHSNYLTRTAAYSLIEEVLAVHPDIVTKLQEISNYITNIANEPTVLATLATKTDVAELQALIDDINDIESTTPGSFGSRLNSLLSTRKYESTQIDTEFVDESGQKKDLNEVLTELRNDLNADYGNINANEVILEEDIIVELGVGGSVGGLNTADTLSTGQTLTSIVKKLVRREIKPNYTKGFLTVATDAPQLIEVGASFDLTIDSVFTRLNSGLLTRYYIDVEDLNVVNETAISEQMIQITVDEDPLTISVYADYAQGDILPNNFGEPVSEGRIPAGRTEKVEISIVGTRALFVGGSNIEPTINSTGVRSFTKTLLSSYENLDLTVSIPVNSKYILFAIPTSASDIKEIVYREQGIDILDLFTINENIAVNGNGLVSAAMYNVYVYEMGSYTPSKMTLTFKN